MTEEQIIINNIKGNLRKSEYVYKSLPICIIDDIYSLRTNYNTTLKVVKNYAKCFLNDNETSPNDDLQKFITNIKKYGYDNFASKILNNKQKSPGTSILKIETCTEISEVLIKNGIINLNDFQKYTNSNFLDNELLKVKGFGQAALKYLYMLAGNQNFCKPDVHIVRFIRDVCEIKININKIQDLFKKTVIELNTYPEYKDYTVRDLDSSIWNFQRNNNNVKK